jgi:hypothetical protein
MQDKPRKENTLGLNKGLPDVTGREGGYCPSKLIVVSRRSCVLTIASPSLNNLIPLVRQDHCGQSQIKENVFLQHSWVINLS